MKLRILIGFLAVLLVTSCQQQSTSLTGDSGVEGALCEAFANPPEATIPTNVAGLALAAVDFSVLVNSNQDAVIDEVKVNGVIIRRPNVQPTTEGMSHTIVLPVRAIGSHKLEFLATSQRGSARCETTVTTTPQLTTGPVITSLVANPPQLSIGSTVDVSATVEGAVDTLRINDQPVSLLNGTGFLPIVPATSGTLTYRAVATGPGGTNERTVSVNVAPRCEIRGLSIVSYVGANMTYDVTIAGAYTSAVISAPGLQTTTLPANTTSMRVTVPVTSAMGLRTATLNLTAANGQAASCSEPVNTIADPGTALVFFTMDGTDTANRQFYSGQRVRFQWYSIGASSCTFTETGLNLPDTTSGDLTITMPATAQNIVFACSRTVSGSPTLASKTIGHSIAIPQCSLSATTTTPVVIGDLFRFSGRSTAGPHRSATVTGANIATYNKGAGDNLAFNVDTRVTGNSASKTVTMTMDLAPGVSTTCTATGP
jgi:hypothetical protein